MRQPLRKVQHFAVHADLTVFCHINVGGFLLKRNGANLRRAGSGGRYVAHVAYQQIARLLVAVDVLFCRRIFFIGAVVVKMFRKQVEQHGNVRRIFGIFQLMAG